MQTLYLVRGIPGAGKTSFAHLLKGNDNSCVVVEADDYFLTNGAYQFDASLLSVAHQWCQDRTQWFLNYGYSVIVSNTSTTEKEVKTYQKIAERCNVQFISLIVENRHGGKDVHNVPAEKIEQMKNRFSVKP